MSLVADRNDMESGLNPQQRALLDRLLRLRPTQQKRILQLVELYRNSVDTQESEEIGAALAEILFRNPPSVTASKIEDERSDDGGAALTQHRQYVGRQIKKRRHQLKVSQEELAQKAGLPQSHISRLETGKHAPTYLTIEKVAKALRVKPSQLDPGFDD